MIDAAHETSCIVFDRSTMTTRSVAPADLVAELENDDVFAWVDIHGPRIDLLNDLAARLGLAITPEDRFGTQEILPRLTEAADHGTFYLHEVLHPERHLEVSRGLTPIEVVRLVVVLSARVVLTYHRKPVEAVQDALAACDHEFRTAGRTPAFIVFLLLQENLYDVAHLNLANDNYLDELQARVVEPGETSLPDDVAVAGRNILMLKKLAASLHIVLMRLAMKKSTYVSDAARESFAMMLENAIATREAVDSSRDLLDGVLQSIQTEAANRTSEIARVLTVISGVLLPVTLVASIYGMNFVDMPGLKSPLGFWASIALMGAIAAGQMLLFRRLGWIGHPKPLRPRG